MLNDSDFIGAVIFLLTLAAGAGAAVFWAAPKVWSWVKPWIHAVTG